MGIDVFISPVFKSTALPARIPEKQKVVADEPVAPNPDFSDLAREGEWEAALLQYLRGHGGEYVTLWRAINEIAASTMPERTWMLRETKKRLLEALGDLIRLKKVARWRRSYIRALDIGER